MQSFIEQHSQTGMIESFYWNQSSSASSPFWSDNESSSTSEPSLSTDTSHIIHYGPIHIRLRRSIAPTLATGRRSKYEPMFGVEALKREERREKNRLAARKLKEKRQSIESELLQQVDQLETDQSKLTKTVDQLCDRKQQLESELNQVLVPVDPIVRLLSTDKQSIPLFFDEHPDDFDILDLTFLSAGYCDTTDELHTLLNI